MASRIAREFTAVFLISATLLIAATSENTPPTLVINQVLVIAEGGYGVITNELLLATDLESPPDSIFFEVAPDSSSVPTEYGLFRNGTEILTYGSFFTQADIDSNQITYQHDGSETITDGFAFRVTDPQGGVASDQGFTIFYFGILITPVNDPPTARDTTYATAAGVPFTDVLPGDDPDSPGVTYTIDVNGTLGTATIVDPNAGFFSYSPLPELQGTDAFTYDVFDGFLHSVPGTVTVNVGIAPTARDTAYITNKGVAFTDMMPASDPDSPDLIYSIVMNGTLGTATIVDADSGLFSYSPIPFVEGTDEFTYQVFDGFWLSNLGTVTIDIVNGAPVTTPDSIVTNEGVPYYGILSAFDPDNDPMVFRIDSDGSLGNAVITDSIMGDYAYTPSTGLFGWDLFTFIASDGELDSSPDTIVVSIRPSLDAGHIVIGDDEVDELFLFDPVTSQVGALSRGGLISSPRGIALEPDGGILMLDQFNGLFRVDPADGSQTIVSHASNFSVDPEVGPVGLVVESSDAALVADPPNGILRVDMTTGDTTFVASGGSLVFPAGLALAENGDILVADAGAYIGDTSRVVRVDPITGDQTVISDAGNLTVPLTIAVEDDGNLLISDMATQAGGLEDLILRIDPITGAQTVLSSGGLLALPRLAVTNGGRIFVTNELSGDLLDVDPVTGAQTRVVSAEPFDRPAPLAIVPGTPTDVYETPRFPAGAWSFLVYPNPSSTTATLQFQIPERMHVNLEVYDVLGRLVAELVDEERHSGHYRERWTPQTTSNGVYFFRLQIGQSVQTRRFVLVR